MARITTEQRVKITVAPKTQAGHDANIDGAIAFESSDASVAAVEPIDGNSAYVVAQGKGAAQISAKFDADLGEGVRTIELSGAVEVVDAEAVSGELTFGEPELNPNA